MFVNLFQVSLGLLGCRILHNAVLITTVWGFSNRFSSVLIPMFFHGLIILEYVCWCRNFLACQRPYLRSHNLSLLSHWAPSGLVWSALKLPRMLWERLSATSAPAWTNLRVLGILHAASLVCFLRDHLSKFDTSRLAMWDVLGVTACSPWPINLRVAVIFVKISLFKTVRHIILHPAFWSANRWAHHSANPVTFSVRCALVGVIWPLDFLMRVKLGHLILTVARDTDLITDTSFQ